MKTGFRVVFYRNMEFEGITPKTTPKTTLKTTPKTGPKLAQNWPKHVQKIIDAITKNPYIALEALQKTSKLSKSGVKYVLTKLKQDKVIGRVGGSR